MKRAVCLCLAFVLVGAGVSCDREQQSRDVTVSLSGTCAPQGVRIIAVELWGIDSGQPCALARRCLFDVDIATIADVESALSEVNQPLIDVDDDDAHTVAIVGHSRDCFASDDHGFCGQADLRDVVDGTLPVVVSCESCPSVAFCP